MNHIEKAIELKTKEKQMELYNKYNKLYQVTYDIIKEKKMLLYGGTALNLILPKKDRFYDDYELPDYDFFTSNALDVAKELADKYVALGYNYVQVKQGIHYATYKLFVEFMPVADITDIPKNLYERMHDLSLIQQELFKKNNPSLEIYIAPLDFLRLSIHLELSRPDGFIERWSKIFDRMNLLYNYYPLEYVKCDLFTEPEVNKELVEKIVDYAKEKSLVVVGNYAIKKHFKNRSVNILSNHMASIELITITYNKTIDDIVKLLSKTTKVTKKSHAPLNKNELIPRHTEIRANKRIICIVYNSTACYAVKKMNNLQVGTFDTILNFLYASLLSNRKYYDKNKIRCLISEITQLMQQSDRFKTNCVGKQIDIADILKRRLDKGRSLILYKPKKISH